MGYSQGITGSVRSTAFLSLPGSGFLRFDVLTPEPEIKADREDVDDYGIPEGKGQDGG